APEGGSPITPGEFRSDRCFRVRTRRSPARHGERTGERHLLRSQEGLGSRYSCGTRASAENGCGVMSEEQAVFDLVKAINAVLHGCDHDAVMSALGTVTLLAIISFASDRDNAEAMAEEFAEVI